MSTETMLLIALIILVVLAVPSWPYSSSWGYTPISVLGLVLIVFLVWALAENRPLFRSTGDDIRVMTQDAARDVKQMGRETADNIRDAVN